jgi:hypothetical protein
MGLRSPTGIAGTHTMIELLYDKSAGLIACGILVVATVAVEFGHFIGRRLQARGRDMSAERVDSALSSMLLLLALVLGFTFSLALQRFDHRSEGVVDESNAIGTAYLRAYLLPTSVRGDVLQLLRDYVDLRVQVTAVSLDRYDERKALLEKAAAVQDVLWHYARQAAEENPNPVTSGLFIQSLNDMIDSFGRRNASLDRHVPEPVSYVLLGVFVIVCTIIGFNAGVAGHRPFVVNYLVVATIILLMFIIIDLDRPRRGIIQVDKTSLIELQAAIAAGTFGNGVIPPR